jgi:phage terminase small subunit
LSNVDVQAAIRAGYSLRTARQTGAENLTKPDIAATITEGQATRAERTEISVDRVRRDIRHAERRVRASSRAALLHHHRGHDPAELLRLPQRG